MSLVLKSNSVFVGNTSNLPTLLAPLPVGAAYHFDYSKNIFVGWQTNGLAQSKNYNLVDNVTTTQDLTINALGEFERSYNPYYENGVAKGIFCTGDTIAGFKSAFDLASSDWTKTNLTVAAKTTAYSVPLITASAVTAGLVSASQPIVLSSGSSVTFSAIAKKGTARYLMLDSLADSNCFAVFDLEKGVVTNVGSSVYNTTVLKHGNYFQCGLGSVSTAVLSGTARYSIVKSPTATPASIFDYDGTETMYLSLASATSGVVLKLPNSSDRDTRTLVVTQKVTVQNAVTFMVKLKLGGAMPITTVPRILEIGTTDSGSITLSFKPVNVTNNLQLSVGRASTINGTLIDVANYSDLLWKENTTVTLLVRLMGNKLSIVHKDFTIEDVAISGIAGTWTLGSVRMGRFLDGIVQKYTQWNKSLTISEMKQMIDSF